jgi:hypothetical protein
LRISNRHRASALRLHWTVRRVAKLRDEYVKGVSAITGWGVGGPGGAEQRTTLKLRDQI